MTEIKGLEGLYAVTKSGEVYNVRNPNSSALKICKSKNGYLYFKAWNNGVAKHITIHRAIAMTFIPNPKEKPCVNHLNGIKDDNRVKNLEWCTHKENAQHAYRMGLYGKPPEYWKGKKGADHIRSKPIFQYDLNGNLIAKFDSTATAVRETGLNRSSIKACLNGRIKTGHGFVWIKEVNHV